MRVAILDYGVGNLYSLARSLAAGGATVAIEQSLGAAISADALVLPGVGAFGPAAERLAPRAGDLRSALLEGLPCLGICLGMQLLFDSSEEAEGSGVGLLPGRIRRLQGPRVPHMGWNVAAPADARSDPLLKGVAQPVVYYANSFVADPEDAGTVVAWTRYGDDQFPAVVRAERTWGVQFHPEKSGPAGLRIIRNFLGEV